MIEGMGGATGGAGAGAAGDAAFWHGWAFRLQKEDQEEKLLKIACRIRGTVSETPCCSQALRSQVLELLLFFP